jgi:hypothetical protein
VDSPSTSELERIIMSDEASDEVSNEVSNEVNDQPRLA